MALDLSTTARLMEAIKGIAGEASRSTRTVPAVCTRVDSDGNAWVRAVGSSEDTPIDGASTSVVEAGDMVNVDVSDGTATIVGNMTSPSVGRVQLQRVAESVRRMGSSLMESIDVTSGIAGAAERVAKAINQHFWTDDSGVHVTQATKEEWQDSNAGPNVLINSLGQLFRDGLNNLLSLLPAQTATDTFTGDGSTTAYTLSETPTSIVSVTVGDTETTAYTLSGTTLTLDAAPASGDEVVVVYRTIETVIAIWDGLGNAASNVAASFGETVTIGHTDSNHVTIDSDSVDFSDGTTTRASFAPNETTIGALTAEEMHDEGWTEAVINLLKVNGVPTFIIRAAYSGLDFTNSIVKLMARSIMRIEASGSYIAIGCPTSGIADLYPMWFHDGNDAGWIFENAEGVTAMSISSGGTVTHAPDVSATSLPLSSAVQAYSDAQAPHYSRCGNVVQVVGAVKPTSEVAAGGSVTIGTLPAGCRPSQELEIVCQGSTNHTWLLRIYSSGSITGERYRNGATSDAMPTNAWLTFSATFLV